MHFTIQTAFKCLFETQLVEYFHHSSYEKQFLTLFFLSPTL